MTPHTPPGRPMAAMLVDVAQGAMAAGASAGVRPTRIEVDLPVDIRLRSATLSAELPLFVRRTAFDAPPSRLHLVWEVTAA